MVIQYPCSQCDRPVKVDIGALYVVCVVTDKSQRVITHPSQKALGSVRFACPRHGWVIEPASLTQLMLLARNGVSIKYMEYPKHVMDTKGDVTNEYINWGLASTEDVWEAIQEELNGQA